MGTGSASSLNSTSSSVSNSSTNSMSIQTVIPNRNFNQAPASTTNSAATSSQIVMRPKKTDQVSRRRDAVSEEPESSDAKIDRLLISYRRLCVDNHLNETLRNSIIDATSKAPVAVVQPSTSSAPRTTEVIRSRLKSFYEKIPILLHEPDMRMKKNAFMRNIKGRNVSVNESDASIAYREVAPSTINMLSAKGSHLSASAASSSTTSSEMTENVYAFLDKPIENGKQLFLK
jgi:hypothetical protein